jgi:hypothetical protein
MIEAAHYGKPTIAFDTPIVREILGERGLQGRSLSTLVREMRERLVTELVGAVGDRI